MKEANDMELDEESKLVKQPSIENKGPFYTMFNGKLIREVEISKDGEKHISSENKEEFSTIFLNPTTSSDLYGGWDNEFVTTAELEENKATVYSWITYLPEILMFSIVRAQ